MEIPAERHDFKMFSSGNDAGDPLATNSEGPSAGKHYTIVAMNKDNGKADLNAVIDDLVRPDVGKTKVRVINTSYAAGDVDIYQAGTTNALISGAGVDHATNYKQIDPTTAELDIRRGGSKKNEVKLTDVNLKPDKFYTILITGTKGMPIKAQVIEDQFLDNTTPGVPRG